MVDFIFAASRFTTVKTDINKAVVFFQTNKTKKKLCHDFYVNSRLGGEIFKISQVMLFSKASHKECADYFLKYFLVGVEM